MYSPDVLVANPASPLGFDDNLFSPATAATTNSNYLRAGQPSGESPELSKNSRPTNNADSTVLGTSPVPNISENLSQTLDGFFLTPLGFDLLEATNSSLGASHSNSTSDNGHLAPTSANSQNSVAGGDTNGGSQIISTQSTTARGPTIIQSSGANGATVSSFALTASAPAINFIPNMKSGCG